MYKSTIKMSSKIFPADGFIFGFYPLFSYHPLEKNFV